MLAVMSVWGHKRTDCLPEHLDMSYPVPVLCGSVPPLKGICYLPPRQGHAVSCHQVSM